MKVVKITNNGTHVWISSKRHGIILTTSDSNTLLPHQRVAIDSKHIRDLVDDDSTTIRVPHVFHALKRILQRPYIEIEKFGKIQFVEYEHVIHGIVERNNSMLVGRLLLSSKTSFGKNSSGLQRYLFRPLNPEYPNFVVASKLKSNRDVYCKIEILAFDERWVGTVVEYIGDLNDESKYDRILADEFFIRDRSKRLREFKREFDASRVECEFDEDWTDAATISIDPAGCKDIDDAISVTADELAIHIATPTRFIDSQIEHQTASLYGVHTTFNLIPPQIAENHASLVENEERICLSVVFSTKPTRLVRTRIRNRKNLTYENCVGTHEYTELRKKFIDLFGDDDIDSHELVEKLMVETNIFVAKFLVDSCHRTSVLRTTIDEVAYYLPFDQFQNNEHCVIKDIYTHFTSPIRRLADQLVHRELFEILRNEDNDLQHVEFNTLVHLNLQSQRLKQYYNSIKKLKYFKDNDTPVRLKGEILNIDDIMFRVQFEDGNIMYIPIVSNRIEENINITKMCDCFHVTCDDNKLLVIDREVEICIHFNRDEGLDGFKVEWVTPDVHSFLNQ